MRWIDVGAAAFLLLALVTVAQAHSVSHQVESRSLAVARIFFDADEPAAYAPYEVFAPGTEQAHVTGRTDRNGFLCFVPDRPGVWKVKVAAESEHGVHGSGFDLTIDASLKVSDFQRPLVATHLKLVIGVTLILGLVSLGARRPRRPAGPTPPATTEVA